MKKELIEELLKKFEEACQDVEGIECWSARDMQVLLGYTKWSNFSKVVDKAKESCINSGEKETDHFATVGKMVIIGSGAERELKDIALTRYACYLVAQNGNSSKPEIAFAQTYFAVQTRKQEIIEQRLLETERVNAREKLSESEKVLSGIIFERGVNNRSFGRIRSKGDQALFGGLTTRSMKERLNVPSRRPLADFLPTLTIKAKDFAAELTSHNVIEKNLHGDKHITTEHVDNNSAIRTILLQRGVKPEDLPPEEDIKKLQRRFKNDSKKIIKALKSRK